jgi:glycosyltransferase involved in cell wall biosynthesis
MTTEGPAQPSVTACLIARDEERMLPDALTSVQWADEVLVVLDDRTRDASAAVAAPLAHRVERVRFESFPAVRNRALQLATGPWVFFVDADERASPALAAEVREATQASARSQDQTETTAPVGYWVPRYNIISGRLIRGGGWAPDYQLRLLLKSHAFYDEARLVHETVLLDGPEGWLSERLLHLNYESRAQFHEKQAQYVALEAESERRAGISYRRRALIGQPIREFYRRLFALGGWVDGPVGFDLAAAMAYYTYRRVQLVRSADSALGVRAGPSSDPET